MTSHAEPHPRLLDRHTPRVANKEFLEHVDRVFTEVLNRASHVFARSWTSVPDTLLGQVPLMLFRHILEMIDGVHVLLLESASAPARLELRSAFEALVYLEYMLADTPALRTQVYVVGSYMWGLKYSRRLQKGSPERKTFLRELGSQALRNPEVGRGLLTTKADVKKYEDFMRSPELQEGYDCYVAFKQLRGRWPKVWYEAVDPKITSLRHLCVHLDRGGEYLGYDLWSRAMHPDLLAVHSIKPPGDGPQRVRKLRDGDRINDAIRTSVAFVRDSCQYALRHARPQEAEGFLRKWSQEIDPWLNELGDEQTIWHPESPSA